MFGLPTNRRVWVVRPLAQDAAPPAATSTPSRPAVMTMFEAMQRSWSLTQEAWDVLRQDRELVLFPILSGICSLLASALFVVPILFMMPWGDLQSGAGAG